MALALATAPGCEPAPPAPPADVATPASTPAPAPAPAPAAIDPDPAWTETLRARVPTSSGLGIGSPVLPLALATPEATACEACTRTGVPRLLVVADLDAPELRAQLQDLDAIAQLYADDGLVAVAVVVPFADGRARVARDRDAVLARAAELRRGARLTMPLTTAVADAAGKTRWFDEYLAVSASPTVMLVGRDDRVVHVDAQRRRWGDLDRAIVELVATRPEQVTSGERRPRDR